MLHTRTKWNINNCVQQIGRAGVIQNYFNENKDKLKFSDPKDYYHFQIASIPPSVYLSDPLIKFINDKYEIEDAGIIRIEPNRCYKWHIDTERGVGINMLLSNSRSFVLFGKDCGNPSEYEIVEFNYQPGVLYWFNTQIMHTVINFEQPRYLFSVEFVLQKDKLTFDMATYQ
jgi:hypothetical protein